LAPNGALAATRFQISERTGGSNQRQALASKLHVLKSGLCNVQRASQNPRSPANGLRVDLVRLAEMSSWHPRC
jgi:hypothetical protein